MPLVVVDSYYYGKLVVAPLNIVLYNVFTSHGPDLYGEFKIRQRVSRGFSCYYCAAVTHQVLIANYLSDVLKSRSSLQAPKGCSSNFLPQNVSIELEIGRSLWDFSMLWVEQLLFTFTFCKLLGDVSVSLWRSVSGGCVWLLHECSGHRW